MRLTSTLILFLLIPFQSFTIQTSFNDLPPQVKDTLKNANGTLNFEGEPSSLVNGNVNVITGDFSDSDIDLQIPGAVPITINRSYVSSNTETKKVGPLQTGWNLNHHGRVTVISNRSREWKTYATHEEGLGISTLYEGPDDNGKSPHTLTVAPRYLKAGITNTSQGEISGRTNRKNSRAFARSCHKTCQVQLSDGTTRYFHMNRIGNAQYSLVQENQSNGNLFTYTYDGEQRLNAIKACNQNSEILATLEIYYPKEKRFKNDPHINFYSSDGRKIRYEFLEKDDRYLLNKVIRPNAPTVIYDYEHDEESRIISKTLPEGRFLAVNYYHQGSNKVNDEKIKVGPNEWRLNRVKELIAPITPDGQPHTIYTFHYEKGTTTVRDAAGNKTDYAYDKNHRLTTITHYLNNSPYSTDKLYWGADKTPNAGHLISRTLESQGKVYCCRHYIYDKAGNVLEKQLYGTLTGTNNTPITLNPQGIPNQDAEYYSEKFTYNEQNLKITEENLRNKITYTYVPNKDLIAAKFISDLQGNIKIRHFYEYDSNAVRILEIVDDGSSTNKENLENVTERRIIRTTPRTQAPIGLPQIIEETYLDTKEILLKRTVNTHDPQGHLLKQEIYDAQNNLAQTFQWEYDSFGNITKEINPAGQITERRFDPNGNKIYEKNIVETHYQYDKADRLITTTYTSPDGQQLTQRNHYNILSQKVTTEDIYGNHTCFTYDTLGRIIETHYPTATTQIQYNALNQAAIITDANGHKLRITYNIHGKPIKVTYPDGAEEKFEYALDGLLTKHTAPNGTITTSEYDFLGRLIRQNINNTQENTWNYSTFHLLSETNTSAETTHYTYDPAGRVVQTHKNGITTTFQYDSLGRKIKTITADITHRVEYDILNRIITEIQENTYGETLSKISYTYDAFGNKTQVATDTGTEIALHKYTYDSFGQCISHQDPQGNETRTIIDHNYYHDYHTVKRVQTILPNAVITETIFNTSGKVHKTRHIDPLGATIRVEENIYDPVGNRTTLIETITTQGQAPRQVITQWQYDWFGRIIARTDAVGTPEQKKVALTYHPSGKKAKLTKADGVEVIYINDQFDRLVQLYATDQTIDYRYYYDQTNHLIDVHDTIHNTHLYRSYDERNNLLTETLPTGLTITYSYDDHNRISQIQLPDQSSVAYQYQNGRLNQVSRLDTQHNVQYTHTYDQFDLRGNILQETGMAGQINHTYDLLNRITKIDAPHFTENLHLYDSVGNLIESQVKDALGEQTSNYAYDSQKQLTNEDGHTYTWDSHYNCVSKDGETIPTNSLHQMLKDSHYDLNGNLISNQDLRFKYDALDRLVQVETKDQTYNYHYDSFNRRISKQGQNFLYFGDNEVGAYENNHLTQFRVLGIAKTAEIGATISIELDGKAYMPIHDHRGNIVSLINTDGVAQTYRYGAFGEQLTQNTLNNPWRFSSKRVDDETSFVNFGRRYYVPRMMRWLTPDPIDRVGGPNVYAYVMNNPMTMIDMYGFVGFNRCDDRASNIRRERTPSTTTALTNNIWRKIITTPGHVIKAIGHHFIGIPGLRDIVKCVGHVLAGHNPKTLKTTFTEEHSGFYVYAGKKTPLPVLLCLGINNDLKDSIAAAKNLSERLGGIEVYFIHNATHGTFTDAGETGCQKMGIPTRSVAVGKFALKYLLNLSEDGRIMAITSSQGAEILYQSAKSLTRTERQSIIATTLGGARLIQQGFLGRCTNYVSNRDMVPAIADPYGYFCAKIGDTRYKNVNFMKSEGNYFIDHSINTETYRQAIGYETQKYFEMLGE